MTTVLGGPFAASSQRAGPVGQVELVARDNALAHVRLLTPPDRRRVWVSSLLASSSGLAPGEGLTLSENGRQVTVPVAGIYQDIKAHPKVPSSWWCSLAGAIYYQSCRPSITLGSQQASSCRGPACWTRQGSEPPVGRSTTWRPPTGCSQR